MSNPSKAKGTRAETRVVRYLQGFGIDAKRKPLAGSKDEGDVEIMSGHLLSPIAAEVKAGKQTANPSRAQLEEWLRQAKAEAKNSGADRSVLIVVRYRRAIEDADVWIQYVDGDGYETVAHQFLDEFAVDLI